MSVRTLFGLKLIVKNRYRGSAGRVRYESNLPARTLAVRILFAFENKSPEKSFVLGIDGKLLSCNSFSNYCLDCLPFPYCTYAPVPPIAPPKPRADNASAIGNVDFS